MKNINKKNNIVILAPNNILDIYVESLKYSFNVDDIILIDDSETNEFRNDIINKINDDKNIQKVIFFDYCYTFHQLIQRVSNQKDKYIIIKNAIAEMTSSYIYEYIKYYLEYLNRGLIKKIAFLDPNFYMDNNNSLMRLRLDIPTRHDTISTQNNNIGIISYDFYEYHNFFNQVSAIKKISNTCINIFSPCNITKEFFDDFGVGYQEYNSIEEIINNSKCLLYVNFCYDDILYLLKCIDAKKVCIMGNYEFEDKFKVLNNRLIIKSDDDINEIGEKIKALKDEKMVQNIILEQEEFRKNYSCQSKEDIIDFLEN